MLGQKICKMCPFRDASRSKPHLENGVVINPKGFAFCTAKNDWVEDSTPCEGEETLKGDRYVIRCLKCNEIVAEVSITKDEPKKIYNLVYTSKLLAFRKRPDGMIGLECSCSQDTRLAAVGDEKTDIISFGKPPHVATTTLEEAHWNTDTSKFKLELK